MDWIKNLDEEQLTNLNHVYDAAEKYQIDPKLLASVAFREGKLRSHIKSEADSEGRYAYGPMQLRQPAADDMKVDRHDVMQNIDGGARYLKQMLERFGGDTRLALMGYNKGANSDFIAGNAPIPNDVVKYVNDIQGFTGIKPEQFGTHQYAPPAAPPGPPAADQTADGGHQYSPLADAGGLVGAGVGAVVAPALGIAADAYSGAKTLAKNLSPDTTLTPTDKWALSQGYKPRGGETYKQAHEFESGQRTGSKRTIPGTNTTVQPTFRFAKPEVTHPDATWLAQQQGNAPLSTTPRASVSDLTKKMPGTLGKLASKGTVRAGTGAVGMGYAGTQGTDAYQRGEQGDVVGSALGYASAGLGGAAGTVPMGPKARAITTGLAALTHGGQYLYDKLRGQQPEEKSVINKADGGLTSLPKLNGGGNPKTAALKAAGKAMGFDPANKQAAAWTFSNKTPGKMSEWAQNYMNQYVVPTQADRMGLVGGPSYSANQLVLPQYQGRAWGSGKQATASGIANLAKDPGFGGTGNQIFAPLLGSENMHQSNQLVFDKLLREFYRNKGALTPEKQAMINEFMRTGGGADRKAPLFDPFPDFDIADKRAVEKLGETFDARKAIANHAFGGEGMGKTKAQIFDYQKVMDQMRDPTTIGAPSFAVGPRAFRLSGDVEATPRPDLNLAYPYQLHGEDLGVTYTPVPSELSLMDFQRGWRGHTGKNEPLKSGKLPQPGYYEHTLGYTPPGSSERVYPRQQITEEWIKELQRSGFADGGLVHMQSGGNPKLAMMKALASKALPAAERDANLQKFLLPSQEKRRLYHGTTGDVSKFNPNNRIHFLTPEPKFANSFATKSMDPVEGQSLGDNPVIKPGANVMPVHVQAENIFDPLNEQHTYALRKQMIKNYDQYGGHDGPKYIDRLIAEARRPAPYDNWEAMENPNVQDAIKDLGHDAFRVREAGVDNLGMYNAGKIKSAIGNEGTYNTRDLDVNKAEGGLVHLQDGGSPRKAAVKRLATSAYDILGLTPESVAAWRKANAKPYKQQQDPVLAQALDAYMNKQISQADYLRIMNERRPIRPLTGVPGAHSNVDIVSALDPNKAEKGILGLNLQVPEGTRVGNRLDIPAYERYGVYVDTMHDTAGKPIGYGHTGHLKDVEFKSSPTKAARVGLGTKEQALTPMAEAEGQGKSPFAMMMGNQVNTSDDEVRRMLQEYLRDPEWHQIGMNPYRGSQFYDKADMMPVWSAKEKIQAGPLVLARDIEKSDWTDPRLMTDYGVNYKEGGLVHMQSGGNPRMAALKALGKQFAPKVSSETKPGWAGVQEPVSVSLQTEKGLPFEMRREWPGKYSFSVDGKDAGAINYVKSPIGEWNPNVMVNPEFQRQGIANSVYDFLEQNVIKAPFSSSGGQSEAGRAFREARAAKNYKEGGLVGLYANIHAKQERIKHGSGEKMRKPGSEGAPTAEAFRKSAKTAKRR